MSKCFFGPKNKKCGYFEGWYLKHQTPTETVALIPACHMGQWGKQGSLQVITEKEAFFVPFSEQQMQVQKNKRALRLGNSVFSPEGCRLRCFTPGAEIYGDLSYTPFAPPKYSIMGPFSHILPMECSHTVYSFHHRVWGNLTVNGRTIEFKNALGYGEGDKGRSFPQKYLWTQCSFANGCLMAAAATIPMGPLSFTGAIGAVWSSGREYRLATYLGLRLLKFTPQEIWVRQGPVELRARLLQGQAQPLLAPRQGVMSRTVYESAASVVRYQLWVKGNKKLDVVTDRAGFEYSG